LFYAASRSVVGDSQKTWISFAPQVPSSKGGYEFIITYPDASLSVTPSINGYTPVNEGFGGGGSGNDDVTYYGVNYNLEYAGLPKGKLTITFTSRVVEREQAWTLPWQP
jgi:hypothetical protein